MGRFVNDTTKVVVSVDDSKDDRFPASAGWTQLTAGQSGEPEPEPEGYAAMKLPEIKAEIERRNDGRADEDKIPTAGNKPDLIAALETDDEQS